MVPTRWVGPTGSVPTLSFSDVLYGNLKSDTFKDKIVLVGMMFPESKDSFLTAFSADGEMYGIEVHAQWVQSLKNRAFLDTPAPLVQGLINLALFALIGALLVFVPIRWFFPALIAAAALAAGLIKINGQNGRLWSATAPLVGFVTLSQAALWARYLQEMRARKRIISHFLRYVSPKIVKSLVENEQDLMLGGALKDVAVLFTDIRNFITLSEKWAPQKIVQMLNSYFKELCDAVFEFDGTVNKFIGDALMAIYSAPLHQNDAAERAVKTALSMRRRLSAFNSIRVQKGEQPIATGIGIHYGEVVSGNIGSPNLEYTVIGDTVNTASRVESLCKEFKTDILISDVVYQFVRDKVEVVTHPPVQVKGRSVPIIVHSLVRWKEG